MWAGPARGRSDGACRAQGEEGGAVVELRKVTSRRPAMPDTHKYKLDLANPHPSRRGEAQEPRL